MSLRSQGLGPRDLAGEIIRRTTDPKAGRLYVIHLSKPPTVHERLQLLAVRLQRSPVAIMPHPCTSVDVWLRRYG